MNILNEIVENKKEEIKKRKGLYPLELLKQSNYYNTKTISLSKYLLDDSKSGIIAEIKRKSPSKGVLSRDLNLEEISIGYMQSGASAISVLTDEKYFGGSNEDLTTVRKFNYCPILRKDFIVDEYQIYEAKSIGADAILLMASVLTKAEISTFTKTARKLGLEVLLEFHTVEELEKLEADLDVIVGVNSRDLKTLKVDISHFETMINLIPDHFIKIAESGLDSEENIINVRNLGYNGCLIGTAFMSQSNPAKAIQKISQNLIKRQIMQYKICGLKHVSNIIDVLKYKPDFVGFIFHEESTRNVSNEEMILINDLDFGQSKKIAVVVNKSTEFILDLALKYNFKYIQLHGDETIAQINILKDKRLKIIKTFSVENQLPENLHEYDAVCDYLLFDTKGKSRGGNGVHFDWNVLLSKDFASPYFLSGGLSYEDLNEIKKLKKQPVALDFNSRLEILDGFKNKNKVKQLKDEIDKY